MALVPRIYIEPYGQQLYKNKSSKSIFKDQNLHSNLIRSLDVNKLTNVFQNNNILMGLELLNVDLSNNDRTINFELSSGRIIQDNTLVDILENINISTDIFSTYNIVNTNNSSNYFEISGNHEENFPKNKVFAIFNSSTSSFNHTNWVVQESSYNNSTNRTVIYTSQSITSNDSTGQIVNDNFPNSDDSLTGTIILTSKYQFQESLDDNPVVFIPIYIDTDYNYFPSFDVNLYKLVYGVISITKDLDNFTINSDAYSISDENVSIFIYGKEYKIRNFTDVYLSNLDGGIIN